MIKGIGKKVYIGGICGVSMSAIARLLQDSGHIVCGSDLRMCGFAYEKLKSCDIEVFDSGGEHIKEFVPDTYIYSVAIKPSDVDFSFAKKNNIQILSRGEALGLIAGEYKQVISVAGSHGKTTTTALISHILNCAGKDVTAHIGGYAKDVDGNLLVEQTKNLFVTEACEYYNSFLHINSDYACILNVQEDHLDFFGNVENLKKAFNNFALKTKERGTTFVNADDDECVLIANRLKEKGRKVVTISMRTTDADVFIVSRAKVCGGLWKVNFSYFGEEGSVCVPMVGEHNIYNTLFAYCVSRAVGVGKEMAIRGIESFAGVKRRYETVGEVNGVQVIHDYAHHPAEIRAVVGETIENCKGRVFVVFEPHTYTRTRDLWEDFAKVLTMPHRTILLPIYPAREKPIEKITSENLADYINVRGGRCYYAENYQTAKVILSRLCKVDDIILVLGAGLVDDFAGYLVEDKK